MRRSVAFLGTVFAALVLLPAMLLFPAFGATPAAAVGLDDFTYESWDVEYELSLDSDGYAVAEVTESLVAIFPDFNQNRGIVRGIPLRYEGAPASPENITVTDENGQSVPFVTEDDNNFRVILVGDNNYVHGRQSYIISYTIRNVMLAATETKVDEFYWDILPLERAQDIAAFSANISLSSQLEAKLTGASACYFGTAYSTDRCDMTQSTDGGGSFEIAPIQMRGGSGVTVAIGFAPGTATQPPERSESFTLDVVPALIGGLGAAVAGGAVVTMSRLRKKRRTHRGVVVAQYDVPSYLPPLIAAPIVSATGNSPAAEFVHLAVNGAIRIEELPGDPGPFGPGKRKHLFRLLDPSRATDPLDQAMLAKLFPGLTPGAEFKLPRKSTKFATDMQSQQASGVAAAMNREYFTREGSKTARLLSIIGLALLVPTGILLAAGSSREPGPAVAFSVIFMAVTVVAAIVGLVPHRVYTPLGAETREYLEGVREFIRVAEADRFRVLQSYTGAERLENGETDIVHIYEKLLPYAMLFGLEKEWGKALQVQYSEQGITSPLWYPALGHRTGTLGGTLASFTSTLSSSASYTSSSSGGSSGGGFSGGGGGGGFSGGR